jgi:[ribosomal protein S5]-alanine N-acetyltransferase
MKASTTITIRPWQLADIPHVAENANNIKIFNNLRDGYPFPYTEKDAREFIEMGMKENPMHVLFAIEVDGLAAGSIGAFFKTDVYRLNAEIGYWLGEKYWRRGIMTEAVRQIVEYLFTNKELHRLYAEPFAHNHGSRRALEKNGFRHEATFRQNVVKNGELQDSCIYALLRNEWQANGNR